MNSARHRSQMALMRMPPLLDHARMHCRGTNRRPTTRCDSHGLASGSPRLHGATPGEHRQRRTGGAASSARSGNSSGIAAAAVRMPGGRLKLLVVEGVGEIPRRRGVDELTAEPTLDRAAGHLHCPATARCLVGVSVAALRCRLVFSHCVLLPPQTSEIRRTRSNRAAFERKGPDLVQCRLKGPGLKSPTGERSLHCCPELDAAPTP
jgi:hypothetical protein